MPTIKANIPTYEELTDTDGKIYTVSSTNLVTDALIVTNHFRFTMCLWRKRKPLCDGFCVSDTGN